MIASNLRTPPMPQVRDSLLYLEDAKKALSREVWNKTQLEDAIRSAEHFIQRAKEVAGICNS